MPKQPISERYPRAVIAGVVIAILLCLWGSFASYGSESDFQQQHRDPYMVSAQFTRLGGVLSAIPEVAGLGYITDAPPGSGLEAGMFLSAQYVLAPRLLKRGAVAEWVLGNFSRPPDFASVGRSQGLLLQQDFGEGVVLFRKAH